MTYLEKYEQEHPEGYPKGVDGLPKVCPGFFEVNVGCHLDGCAACWNMEIEESK